MSVWEQRRQARQEERNQVAQSQMSQVSEFPAPVRGGPQVIQAGAGAQQLAALGINVVNRQGPQLSAQANSVLQAEGLMPPRAQQGGREQIMEPRMQQNAPAQNYEMPVDARAAARDKLIQGGGLQIGGSQPPVRQQNYEAEELVEAPPVSKRQQDIEKYQRDTQGLQFNSYQPRFKPMEQNPDFAADGGPQYDQSGSQGPVSASQKAEDPKKKRLFAKKPSEMTPEEYAAYELHQLREDAKKKIWSYFYPSKYNPSFLKQQVEEIIQQDPVMKEEFERVRQIKEAEEQELKAKAAAAQMEQESAKQQQQQQQQREEEENKNSVLQSFQQKQMQIGAMKGQKPGGQVTSLAVGQAAPMEQFQMAPAVPGSIPARRNDQFRPGEGDASVIQRLETENKTLRERIQAMEFQIQSLERTARDAQAEAKRLAQELAEASKQMTGIVREVAGRVEAQGGQGRENWGSGTSQGPQGGAYEDQRPYGQAQGLQYQQFPTVPQHQQTALSGPPPQAQPPQRQSYESLKGVPQPLKKKTAVDDLLENAKALISGFNPGDETMRRVHASALMGDDIPVQTSILGGMQTNLRQPQYDSVNQNAAELQRLLSQEQDYSTLRMEQPPDDVPTSLLQTAPYLPGARYDRQPSAHQ